MRLFDQAGQRKYLTAAEREAFLRAAKAAPPRVRAFCETLAFTGCRLSEALALTQARVDETAGMLVFESLKKRRRGVYRAVPVPREFLNEIGKLQELANGRLWDWSRTTGWRRVKEIMTAAGISGPHATPKGLRHGFGIAAVVSEVPLNMAQKWLGHSRLETTSIYANAVGPEERRIAERMWSKGYEEGTTQPCARVTMPPNVCGRPFSVVFQACAQFIAFRT